MRDLLLLPTGLCLGLLLLVWDLDQDDSGWVQLELSPKAPTQGFSPLGNGSMNVDQRSQTPQQKLLGFFGPAVDGLGNPRDVVSIK